MFNAESNGTEHKVQLKFCTLLLRFGDIQFILIPTWIPICNFLLKTANIKFMSIIISNHMQRQKHIT